jgi:hypothetical protein
MTTERKTVLGQLKDFLLFVVMALIQGYFMCPRCATDPKRFTLVVLFTFLMWVLLWKGNSFLSVQLSKRISWIDFPVKRFVVGMLITVGYTVGSMMLLMFVFEEGFNFGFGRGYIYTIYGSVIVTIIISFFLHAKEFLRFWREATVEKEKYQKESIAARYESLKNQVNPHFLFNSLNALSNLVYEDQDKAVKFIKQLSEVYRYVLDTRDREVVPLKEELDFLNSYVFLQQIRFGNKLKIEIDLPNQDVSITPLALQMLIENSIKHNVISEDDPLLIRVFEENDSIVVENNLQKKQTLGEPSAGVGLENICKRYELLTDKKVAISEQDGKFVVKLPLLKNAVK